MRGGEGLREKGNEWVQHPNLVIVCDVEFTTFQSYVEQLKILTCCLLIRKFKMGSHL